MDVLANDIESYRQPWESEEHWDLRKEFLEVHVGKFPEDRLLCLAQVYTNVELMDCKYPDGVMVQVCELAKDMKISAKLREERQNRAAVNFVKAEEAKQQKKTGEKRNSNYNNQYPSKFGRSWDSPSRGRYNNRNPHQGNFGNSYGAPRYSGGGSQDNLGFKMLQMMGWTGGGVGKEGNTGITEPVSLKDVYHRVGLGYSEDRGITKEFVSSIQSIVSDFAKSGTTADLAFSPEFSKEERKKIHNIAEKFHLKSVSRGGKGSERHIVLSQRFSPQQLLRHMIEVGGATDKYELIPPMSATMYM